MNKQTIKQLNALENEKRFVQKEQTKNKTGAKKKTAITENNPPIKTVAKKKASSSEKAVEQKVQKKAQPDQATIDAAALEWALDVVKNNRTK